jgi:hypothetical protein
VIKSTPNSNLLTVADSPFQHHLVSLVIYLYIYRHIQMVLDASTTKEESLAYNPQGGRIVLHTACDKEVATFAFGQDLGLPFLVAPWNILFQSARNDIHVVLTRKGKSSFGEKIPTN